MASNLINRDKTSFVMRFAWHQPLGDNAPIASHIPLINQSDDSYYC